MLEALGHQDFEKHIDSDFALNINENQWDLKLIEVKMLRKAESDNQRDQFSLLFEGSTPSCLPQQIYQLNHDEMGELAIFLVPVGENKVSESSKGGYLYEAVFT